MLSARKKLDVITAYREVGTSASSRSTAACDRITAAAAPEPVELHGVGPDTRRRCSSPPETTRIAIVHMASDERSQKYIA